MATSLSNAFLTLLYPLMSILLGQKYVTNNMTFHLGTTASAASSESESDFNRNIYNEGSTDTGWIMLPNGTQVRTKSSWSSSSYSNGRGQANGGRSNGRPQTESGSSDTGWVQLPNGTMFSVYSVNPNLYSVVLSLLSHS